MEKLRVLEKAHRAISVMEGDEGGGRSPVAALAHVEREFLGPGETPCYFIQYMTPCWALRAPLLLPLRED